MGNMNIISKIQDALLEYDAQRIMDIKNECIGQYTNEIKKENSESNDTKNIIFKYMFLDKDSNIHLFISDDLMIDQYIKTLLIEIVNIMNKIPNDRKIDVYIHPSVPYLGHYIVYFSTIVDLLQFLKIHPKVNSMIGCIDVKFLTEGDLYLLINCCDKIVRVIHEPYLRVYIKMNEDDIYYKVFLDTIEEAIKIGMIDEDVREGITSYEINIFQKIKI